MARALDALHGGIRGDSYLNTLSGIPLDQHREEVLHSRPYVVWGYRASARLHSVQPCQEELQLGGRKWTQANRHEPSVVVASWTLPVTPASTQTAAAVLITTTARSTGHNRPLDGTQPPARRDTTTRSTGHNHPLDGTQPPARRKAGMRQARAAGSVALHAARSSASDTLKHS